MSPLRLKSKQCYAIGCGAQISRQMLMCREHWGLVSRSTQNEVYRTYQRLTRTDEEVEEVGGRDSLRPYVVATMRAQLEAAREQGMPDELLDILAADLKTMETPSAAVETVTP
jgi:hypothetical protein